MNCSDSELVDRGRRARKLTEKDYTWDKLANDLHNACETHLA